MIGEEVIKLTQYSHGAGCGCKISPQVLDQMLSGIPVMGDAYPALLVGNAERDDAAVFDLGDGTAIISTTDFFMPVVDDPFAFGRIAAANAISDVYAMGGKPLMAIAILGWPVNVLSADIAGMVIQGGQSICQEAGIPLGGGHSIDSPEPIFGLAVTGRVDCKHLKKNGGAQPGDVLFLSKPIGVGILTTAQKKGKLREEHGMVVSGWMMRLNDIGERLGRIKEVSAMTDVTGFGLAGHLMEMCRASKTSAELYAEKIPIIVSQLQDYIDQGCIPGGTGRNYASYGHDLLINNPIYKDIVCDPQTSGGLLIAVHPDKAAEVSAMLEDEGLYAHQIGVMKSTSQAVVELI